MQERDDHLELQVIDNGPGLTDDIRQILESESYSIQDLQKVTGGIGISVVAHLVSENEGTLSVSSSPEHGTIFTICLPAESTSR